MLGGFCCFIHFQELLMRQWLFRQLVIDAYLVRSVMYSISSGHIEKIDYPCGNPVDMILSAIKRIL